MRARDVEAFPRPGESDVTGPPLLEVLLPTQRPFELGEIAVVPRQDPGVPPQFEVEGLAALGRIVLDAVVRE